MAMGERRAFHRHWPDGVSVPSVLCGRTTLDRRAAFGLGGRRPILRCPATSSGRQSNAVLLSCSVRGLPSRRTYRREFTFALNGCVVRLYFCRRILCLEMDQSGRSRSVGRDLSGRRLLDDFLRSGGKMLRVAATAMHCPNPLPGSGTGFQARRVRLRLESRQWTSHLATGNNDCAACRNTFNWNLADRISIIVCNRVST